MHTAFWGGNVKERGHLEDLSVKGIRKTGWDGVDWINP
jgi:hypothetical protein